MFVIGLLSTPATAQDITFESFTDELGGQQSSVYGIYKDKQGFLWFSGDTDGLLRYDGYEIIRWFNQTDNKLGHVSHGAVLVSQNNELWATTWGNGVFRWQPKELAKDAAQLKIFTHDANDTTNSLLDNRTQVVFEDSQKRILIGTLGGLNYFEPGSSDSVLSLPSDNPLSSVRIWAIAETSDSLWFATTEGLIQLSLDLKTWHQYLPNPHEKGTNRLNEVRTVMAVDDEVWIGFDEGVLLWNAEQRHFDEVTYPAKSNQLRAPRANVLMAGENGSVYVGAEDGLYSFDRHTLMYSLTKNGVYQLMDGVDIRSLAIDNNKSIWLGTRERGLFHSRANVANFGTLSDSAPAELHPLLNRSIGVTHIAADNSLWVGIQNGVLRRSGHTGQWQHWTFPLDTTARSVESILKDSTGNTWIAANNHLFYVTESEPEQLQEASFLEGKLNLPNATVTDIFEYKSGRVWFSIWGVGVVELNLETGETAWVFQDFGTKHSDFVYDIVHVPNQGIWIVTRYSGLFYRENGTSQWLNYNELAAEPLPSNNLLCGYTTQDTLWICSEQGLISLDLVTLQVKIYTKADGLPSNRVAGVVTDTSGKLWITTSRGLVLFEQHTEKFITFGLSDGLPALAFLGHSIARAVDGNVVAGTVKGAVEFKPKMLTFDSRPPTIGLSRVSIDDEDITRTLNFNQPSLELPRRHRNVVVQYAVLDLHDPSRNTGRYRLLGLTNEWSTWSNMRQLTFNTLAPGSYTLEVEGRNSLGIGSEQPMRLPIMVHQPWWYAMWIRVLFGLAIVFLLMLLINLRIRALERVNERLDAQVQARTRELEKLNIELREQSHTDYLTKLPNRRGFTERFNWLAAQLKRNHSTFSLVLLDVDKFKSFNDTYGHEAGDAVLVALSKLLRRELREQDIAGRWGGEEFAILLPNTDRKHAQIVCEKLRDTLEKDIIYYGDTELKITATFGIYQSTDTTKEALSIERWIARADQALYQGKELGRNRVVIYEDDL